MLQVETNLKTENIFGVYSTWNSLEPWTGSYFVVESQVMCLSRWTISSKMYFNSSSFDWRRKLEKVWKTVGASHELCHSTEKERLQVED